MFVFAGAVVSPAIPVGRLEGLSKWRAAAVASWSANLLVVPQLRTVVGCGLCILVEMVCGHRVSEKPSNYLKTTHHPSLLGTPVHNYGPSFRRLKRRAAPRRVGPASAK